MRLEICLRYLASDSMRSLSYAFRVGQFQKLCPKRAKQWIALKDKVFEQPSKDLWKKIANEENWDFPNCIGAIDGKLTMEYSFNL